ncbi:hypothetical protein P691DRAFT_151495 [Macrolepiota fuliginosa MF-IS2]|uniref:Uncharacterized protein n=1 Tax=Macrolepiota fuliginosa MF-IS2 TaxID=1400762 RepID=A0A9P6C0V1_9AGAR|nr:hypothetical protein P691DRAFT_151495 [Macrolepiota fuliginosa MF-IS2]
MDKQHTSPPNTTGCYCVLRFSFRQYLGYVPSAIAVVRINVFLFSYMIVGTETRTMIEAGIIGIGTLAWGIWWMTGRAECEQRGLKRPGAAVDGLEGCQVWGAWTLDVVMCDDDDDGQVCIALQTISGCGWFGMAPSC